MPGASVVGTWGYHALPLKLLADIDLVGFAGLSTALAGSLAEFGVMLIPFD